MVESGGGRVDGGDWMVETGGWRLDGGDWMVETGWWRLGVETGWWRREYKNEGVNKKCRRRKVWELEGGGGVERKVNSS